MSANLPLTWLDKKNSPELEAFLKQYGDQYCMKAEEINQLRDAVNEMAVIQQSTFLGAAEPTFTPAGTGRAYWIAVKPGTYANHGGVVVGANEIAFIIRDVAGSFSISKTGLDLSMYLKIVDGNKINTWRAKAYSSGDQVNYMGKDWVSNAATISTDIPATSSKWVERLIGYIKNDIYANDATGPNIARLLFIKDFTISNPTVGKIYSIASVVKNATDTRIKVYTADDYLGTNLVLKTEFIFQNSDSIVSKTNTTNSGEVYSIIASPIELPSTVSYTSMFGTDYKLNSSVFKNGKASESLLSNMVLNNLLDNYPYLSLNSANFILRGAIKELYLFGIVEQDVKITTFKKNTAGNEYNVTIYNTAVTTKLASFVSTGIVLTGIKVLTLLSTTNAIVGYLLIDWDAIAEGANYQGVLGTEVLLTRKVFFKENNPILFSKINENRIISLETAINVNGLNNYPFTIDSTYSTSINKAIKELYLFGIVEQDLKITTFKKNTAGNEYNISIYDTNITTKLGSFVSLGVVLTGLQIHPILTLAGDITGYILIDWDSIANGYIFQGVNSTSLILNRDVFYKLKSPKIFNYLDNLPDKYYIANFDNEFSFDYAEIEQIKSRIFGVVPNYNLPHTKEVGYISTDIMNELTLNDSSPDFDWMRSKSPNFYFNSQRRGCIILFDETGLAYIINQNNEKKFITLT